MKIKTIIILISVFCLSGIFYFFSSSKKNLCEITLYPVGTGRIRIMDGRSPLDSAVVRLNQKLYFILTYMTGPESSYTSTPALFYPLNENGRIIDEPMSFGQSEHVRQITKIRTPRGEGVLFADHGIDGKNFSGGNILLIVQDKVSGKLIDLSSSLNQLKNFSFNAVAVKNKNSDYDDILIVPYNGPHSRVVFLKANVSGYSDASDLLPQEWRKFQFCFMTALPVDLNADGTDEVALGACDQSSDKNVLDRDRLLIWKNNHWEFAPTESFPMRKRDATWGTVYWLKDKDKLLALTHNKGFTNADVQGFTFDQNGMNLKEFPVELKQTREGEAHYLHKIVPYKGKYFSLIRYARPQDHSPNLMALEQEKQGVFKERNVCIAGNEKSAILGIDSYVTQAGQESLVLFYYNGTYEIYQ